MSMIQPISNQISGAAQVPAAAGARGVPEVRQAGTGAPSRTQRPARDEYVPEEKQEPSGRYWLGKDEDGRPKIYFDDPERAADTPEAQDQRPRAGSPEQDREASGKKAETCTGNTDKVDREIEALKKRREELERQIHSETDDARIKALERQLAQVEGELRQKDNDAYRRQHTVFS